MCFFRLSESRQAKAGEKSCFLSSRPRWVTASSNIDLLLKYFFSHAVTKFFKAGREHPSWTRCASKTSSVRPALHSWCQELPCSPSGSRLHPGQGAGEQHSPALPARHRCRCPSCPGWWGRGRRCPCSPSGGQLCGASHTHLWTSRDEISRLFTTVKLHGYELRGRWIKSNYISKQEGSKKLVRSGAEERTINDSIFV